ncbi:unnamed protein product [Parnassius apollo]|uniref:(apollo) hypothetical protein n=1 Tax=Parnassius apollo TaxID=110799 RepID=A0A8S3WKD0_PARAO|nr:unnamed protein product [Parnassius apollo]
MKLWPTNPLRSPLSCHVSCTVCERDIATLVYLSLLDSGLYTDFWNSLNRQLGFDIRSWVHHSRIEILSPVLLLNERKPLSRLIFNIN